MGAPFGNKNAKNNRGGGRKSAYQELDAALKQARKTRNSKEMQALIAVLLKDPMTFPILRRALVKGYQPSDVESARHISHKKNVSELLNKLTKMPVCAACKKKVRKVYWVPTNKVKQKVLAGWIEDLENEAL